MEPLVEDDVPCRVCGYNLRGLPYTYKCPECGADVDSSWGRFANARVRAPIRIPRAWLVAEAAVPLAGLVSILGFKAYVWLAGFRMPNLWNGTHSVADDVRFLALVGLRIVDLSSVCAVLGAIGALGIGGVGVAARDRPSCKVGLIMLALSLLCGLLAFGTGANLAGL